MKDQSTKHSTISDDEYSEDEVEEEMEEEEGQEGEAEEGEIDEEFEENDFNDDEDEDYDGADKENANRMENIKNTKKIADFSLSDAVKIVPLKLATSTPFNGAGMANNANVNGKSAILAINNPKIKRLTTEQMVTEALKTLSDRKGLSLKAINKYILSNWPSENEARLKTNIKRSVKLAITKGTIVLTKGTSVTGSFKLSEKAKLKSKKAETKKNVLKTQNEKAEAKKAAVLEKEKIKSDKHLEKKKITKPKLPVVQVVHESKLKKQPTKTVQSAAPKMQKGDAPEKKEDDVTTNREKEKTKPVLAKKSTKSTKDAVNKPIKRALRPQMDVEDEVPEMKKSKPIPSKAAPAKAINKPTKTKQTTKAMTPSPPAATVEKITANKPEKVPAIVANKKSTRAKQQKQK